MTLLAALATAWRVAHELPHAVEVARAILEAGGSPVAALRAFAAATDGQLDDQAVAILETALAQGVEVLAQVVSMSADVAETLERHRPTVVAAVDRALGVVIGVGYAASMLAVRLETWRR